MRNLRGKLVCRLDGRARLFRLFRIMWERGAVGVPGGGYSAKLSVALTPRFFRWEPEWKGWGLSLLGVRVHLKRSFGGIFT